MSVIIGHASINENGKVSGGKTGDQTVKEVCTRSWYDKPWGCILRPKVKDIAENSASFVEGVCKNNNVGYDQPQRNTLYKEAKAVEFKPDLIKPCSTDCSEFMSTAAAAAGVPIDMSGNAPTTSTMKKIFKDTGLYEVITDKAIISNPEYQKRGDILLSEGHHTAMVLTNGLYAVSENKESSSFKYVTKHSQVATDMIKKFEGCRLQAYKCAAGVPTIGYGHTEGVYMGMTITQAEADKLLEQDIAKFDKHVDSYNSPYRWNQNEFDALVSFAFNLGTIDKLTNNGIRTKADIAAKMPEYCHAAGKRNEGLYQRRLAERDLFVKSVDTSEPTSCDKKEALKSDDEIVQEVMKGLWGTGADRKKRLTEAGYDYKKIQNKVNSILNVPNYVNVYYTVVKGDTLSAIARKYGTTVNKLVELNKIKDPNKINIGQVIKIK